MQGTIKWFSIKKGYGFIQAQGKDYFVHRWDIEANSELEKGDKVLFEVEKVPKGSKAVKVRKIRSPLSKGGSYRHFGRVRQRI